MEDSSFSKTQYSGQTLLIKDGRSNEYKSINKEDLQEFLFETARYTPIHLIDFFIANRNLIEKNQKDDHIIYSLFINKSFVSIYINIKDKLVTKVTSRFSDPILGDVMNIYFYSKYNCLGKMYFPTYVTIKKLNNIIQEEVLLYNYSFCDTFPLLPIPQDYKIENKAPDIEKISIDTFNKEIYFLNLKNADERVLMVEFKDFLLVAEAPLNSNNGELIIAKAKEIAPLKPIRYFVFGHHHPHYLGGIRPFIHKEITILSVESNIPYLEFLTTAPHKLDPDSLEMQPKKLKVQIIKNKYIITDGNVQMVIYHIGLQSKHTEDYLLYYFPETKILFEDDLAWIPSNGTVKKARKKQAALYKSIISLGLEVDKVIQSWPLKQHEIKTNFSFSELERSVN